MTHTPDHYDVIIIGAGQSGGPLATAFSNAGKKTAIIEREHVGGTCINEGCTPTKTMVASARAAYLARRSADYGVHTGPVSVDLGRVRERKRAIVDSFRSGGERRIQASSDLIDGEARFTGPKAIHVKLNAGGERDLTADWIFLNTGCRPTVPPIEGLQDIPYLTSTTIMELAEVPEHLIMIGGGYIALEFGQMFLRFGSKVTILERGPRLLSREDEEFGKAIQDVFTEDGAEFILNSEVVRVEKDGSGVRVIAKQDGKEVPIRGSHVLVAAGRSPNTEKLNLSAAGIATNKHGYITVDDQLQTNVAGVYALGDVNGGPAFTHISYDDFRIIRTNLIEGGHRTTKDRLVPFTMYIDPQFARVGITAGEAKKAGRDVKIATMPMEYVARALETDETRGLMQAVVDAQTGKILGFTVLGLEGGELMSAVELAMMGGLHYTVLRDAVFAHPTIAESLNNLFGYIE